MSKETALWLNTMVLVGFTEKRGNAWHYRVDLQQGEGNHFKGAVPVKAAQRLLSLPIKSKPVEMAGLNFGGRQVIYREDTGDVLGIFSDGFQIHPYDEWLIKNVSGILGDTLNIGSVGLLRNGGQAWCQIEAPENVETPEGVSFRPHLLASTSVDGTLATSYRLCSQVVVCDNTLSIAHGEKGNVLKFKHTRHSALKISDARAALQIVEVGADDFAAKVKALCETTVTDEQWKAFLDLHVPIPEEEGRGRTVAANKRGAFVNLWNNDNRVSPWRGTAFGVLQADNTYRHHVQSTRGETDRASRNMESALRGKTDDADALVLSTLGKVLESV